MDLKDIKSYKEFLVMDEKSGDYTHFDDIGFLMKEIDKWSHEGRLFVVHGLVQIHEFDQTANKAAKDKS